MNVHLGWVLTWVLAALAVLAWLSVGACWLHRPRRPRPVPTRPARIERLWVIPGPPRSHHHNTASSRDHHIT